MSINVLHPLTQLLFIQNISEFLMGLHPGAYCSKLEASIDQIWKKISD